MPDVSVVIVSYNTRELTVACLRSVFAAAGNVSLEVIVIDNESPDGSAEAVHSEFPQVTLLRPGENLGFARANNVAARRATGEFLLLLNPDTVVLDRAIEKLGAFARSRPEGGAYGGRTLYGDGTLNATSCFDLPSPWGRACAGTGLSSLFRSSRLFNPELIGGWRRDTVRQVGVITGCFLLMRRTLWEELRGFDTSFFMSSEDTDLSYRATRAGYPCLHCPDAVIVHYGGRSEENRADKIVKVLAAKRQFLDKHWGPGTARFGLAMLDFYVAARLATHGALRLVRPASRSKYERWRSVWSRRRAWRPEPVSPPSGSPGVAPCAANRR
jgi:GT2 family glycosyltransferase